MIRYAMLYFLLLIIFVALIAGPIVAGKQIPDGTLDMVNNFGGGSLILKQYPWKLGPSGDNDDTRGRLETGTKATNYSGVWTPTTTSDYVAKATSKAERRMAF